MNVILLILIAIILFVIVKLKLKPQSKQQSKQLEDQSEFSYRKLDALFTPAERSFLGVLNQAINDNSIIFGKVRVADILTPNKGFAKGVWQKAFNKISSKHFDFVICRSSDLSVLCAIELDDSSHGEDKRKIRDAFIEDACKSASFPLVRFVAKSTYSINDLQHALSEYLPINLNVTKNISQNRTEIPTAKICPKCSSDLIIRTSKKGKAAGNEFLGCSAFPKCRYIESESGG